MPCTAARPAQGARYTNNCTRALARRITVNGTTELKAKREGKRSRDFDIPKNSRYTAGVASNTSKANQFLHRSAR